MLFFSSVQADEAATYGLSMHGTPKHTASDTHLSYANPDAPKGGTLKMAAVGSFDSINPFALKGKAAQGLHLAYDRLAARAWDEPFTLYPLIAQSFEWPEDRSALVVTLHPEAVFDDGTPITVEDVVFSWNTLKVEGRPNMRRVYGLASDVTVTGENQVTFTFGEGRDRETPMIFAMMPVLSKAYWEGRTFDSSTLEPPVSSGPYKISEVDPGRKIVYARNEDYWAKDLLPNKGLHNFDTIIYEYYRDETVALEAFKAGSYNYRREFDAARWATQYPESKLYKKKTFQHGRPEATRGLIFNTRRAPFDDINVRRALVPLLDFNWMNTNLYHNQYKRIQSYYPNSDLAARDPIEPETLALLGEDAPRELALPLKHPEDMVSQAAKRRILRESAKMLEEAGWKVSNGKRMTTLGKTLRFKILTSSAEDEKIALEYTRMLSRLGIEATTQTMDSASFQRRLLDYDYDMVIWQWQNSLSPGTEQLLYWSCNAAKTPGQFNWPGICDPLTDKLAAGIADTARYEDLLAHTRALDRLLMQGAYMVPLFYKGEDMIAFQEDLAHPEYTPLYGPVLESWWQVEKKN